jgi:hypothetical protein
VTLPCSQVADAWLDGAPGGPLHDLVVAGALPSLSSAAAAAAASSASSSAAAALAPSSSAWPLPPDGAGLPTGAAALSAAVALLDAFRSAQAAVDRAQWQVRSRRGKLGVS